MRKLIDSVNIDAPSADYPKGRVRNKNGAILGTEYREELLGDIFQFFQKIIIDAGITENDLPENFTNGYQMNDALRASIYKRYSTNTLNDGAMTTTPKDIITFVPDANQSFDDIKITFSARYTHQSSGSNTAFNMAVVVGGSTVKTYAITSFVDGRSNIISFSLSGIPYTAGDIVKITGTMIAGTSTIAIPDLIVEGTNG